ncbi:MAG: PolC-type DNA polymerase III [Chitinispirillaceae bacterium]
MNEEVVVIDFETSGLSPDYSRTIEVGAAVVNDSGIVQTFSQLMNPGTHIPSFITALTGITNGMVLGQPSPEEVMPKLARFIGERPLVAHNASFDSRFFRAEMARADIMLSSVFLCTLRLARRLVPGLPDYKLGTLAAYLGKGSLYSSNAHRAMHDVEITSEVWNFLRAEACRLSSTGEADLEVLQAVMKKAKKSVPGYLKKLKPVSKAGSVSRTV